MIRKSLGLWLFGLVFFTPLSVFSQTDKQIVNEISPEPTSCEVKRMILDRAFADFQKLEDSSSLIFIIRLGINETKHSVALSRINEIEKFVQFRKVTDRYVLAVGSRTDSLGKAEIYVGGKLSGELYFAVNSKLICEPE